MTTSLSTARFSPDNGERTGGRSTGLRFLLASLLVGLALFSAPPLRADEPPSLDALIWQYMDAADGSRADGLLDQILHDPRASVASVSVVLRAGRTYGAEPTGEQPSMPITVRGTRYSYALAVPPQYQPATAYGLVLCLHGAGFTGEAYLERWQGRLGDRYILACPSYSMGAWWTRPAEELVLATIREVAARYHIDPDRIFLTGMSNGGIGAWIIGMHHADLFAGLAPMASGIDDVLFPFLANLKQTPAYVIHGAKDQVMPVRLSREVTEELRKLGYQVVYREHDREHPMAGGHYFPREELPDLVAWLDQQRRGPLPSSVAVVRDATHLGPFAWTRIDATDRIAAFAETLVESSDEFIKKKVYAKILATLTAPNHIDVASVHIRQLSLFLDETLVDVAHPLIVTVNGRRVFEGSVVASLETLLRQARLRQDRQRLYPIHLTIAVPSQP